MGRGAGVAARAVAVATAVSLAVAGCAGSSPVVFRVDAVPTAQATLTNGVCDAHRPLSDGQQPVHGLVGVDSHPQDATAVWIPGSSQRPCRAATVHYSAAVASRLARDVRASPRFPNGEVACPNDDGRGVALYFSYRQSNAREYVWVGLGGCTAVGAPGRSPRRASGSLLRDLAAAAPQPWADAISGSPSATNASITGHLYLVGGPAPGTSRPVEGRVTATGTSGKYSASIGKDGRYALNVRAGTYTVTGSSPLYKDGSPCLPATTVTVMLGGNGHADLYCQMR